MRILVVGSINIDLVTRVDHVPAPGENVRGEDLRFVPGGKGANQAVACARLGAETVMLGRVGDDPFGRRLRDDLARAGVGVEAVRTVPGCASGAALILVDAGPPRRPVDTAVFEADVLTPNEAEAAALLDLEPGAAAPEDLARRLAERARGTVVLKAGAAGCVLAEGGEVRRVPAFPVEPVDTTAAGDAFTAALTVALVAGADLETAARRANAAGALAAVALGAQPSLPTAEALEAFLAERGG